MSPVVSLQVAEQSNKELSLDLIFSMVFLISNGLNVISWRSTTG